MLRHILETILTYYKNDEKIIGEKNLEIKINDILITANKFEYQNLFNIISISENVIFNDKKEDLVIYADKITYFKNKNKFITDGPTEAKIKSRYNLKSKNLTFFWILMSPYTLQSDPLVI